MEELYSTNFKRKANALRNFYKFRDITIKNYYTASPEEQEAILDQFSENHANGKILFKDDVEAVEYLERKFYGMTKERIDIIYRNVLEAKPKSRRLKEKARKKSGIPKAPYCKAETEQLNLFEE